MHPVFTMKFWRKSLWMRHWNVAFIISLTAEYLSRTLTTVCLVFLFHHWFHGTLGFAVLEICHPLWTFPPAWIIIWQRLLQSSILYKFSCYISAYSLPSASLFLPSGHVYSVFIFNTLLGILLSFLHNTLIFHNVSNFSLPN